LRLTGPSLPGEAHRHHSFTYFRNGSDVESVKLGLLVSAAGASAICQSRQYSADETVVCMAIIAFLVMPGSREIRTREVQNGEAADPTRR
jgi:hypothetical protein